MGMQIITKVEVANSVLKCEIEINAERDEIVFNSKICQKMGLKHEDFVGFGKDADSSTIYVFKSEPDQNMFQLKKHNASSTNLFIKLKNLAKTLGFKQDVTLHFNKVKSESVEGVINNFAFSPATEAITEKTSDVEKRRNVLLEMFKKGKTKSELRSIYPNMATFYLDWNFLVENNKIVDNNARTRTKGLFKQIVAQ